MSETTKNEKSHLTLITVILDTILAIVIFAVFFFGFKNSGFKGFFKGLIKSPMLIIMVVLMLLPIISDVYNRFKSEVKKGTCCMCGKDGIYDPNAIDSENKFILDKELESSTGNLKMFWHCKECLEKFPQVKRK